MRNETGTIGRLVRWNAKKTLTFVRTLSFEFSDEITGRIGQVQGLIGADIAPKLGDALVAHIEDAFENGLEEAARKLPASATQEKLFETAVAKVNHALSRLLSDRGLVIPTERVDGVLVAQLGTETIAAVWGAPSMLLVRKFGPGRTKIFDVLEGSGDDRPATNPRGFTNLISGSLSEKDLMLVSNESVLDLLDGEALAEILSSGTPDAVTQLLTDALTAEHDDLSLALLLLEGAQEHAERAVPDAQRRAQRIAPPRTVPRAKSERAVVTPKSSSPLKHVTSAAAAVSSKVAEATGSLISSGKGAVTKAIEERRERLQREEALAMTEGARYDDEEIAADGIAAVPEATPERPEPSARRAPEPVPHDDVVAESAAMPDATSAVVKEAPTEAPKAVEHAAPKPPAPKRRSAETVADLLPKNEPILERPNEGVDGTPIVATTAARKKALSGKTLAQRAMVNEATIIAAARAEAARAISARAHAPKEMPSSDADVPKAPSASDADDIEAPQAASASDSDAATVAATASAPAPKPSASKRRPAPSAPSTAAASVAPVRASGVIEVKGSFDDHAKGVPPRPEEPAVPASAPSDDAAEKKSVLPSSREALDRLRGLARDGRNGAVHGMARWFNGLTAKRRWLLMASLALIVFLNVSVGIAGIQRYRERAAADYDQQLTSIEQKVNSAEASLIYRDEDRSRRLLQEASNIVTALPEKTDEQASKKAELAAFVNEKFNALRHAVTLPAPEVAAAVVEDGGSPNLVRLGAYAGTLWASDAKGDVYRIADGKAVKAGDGIRTDIFVPRHDGLLTGGAGTLTLVKDSGSATALTFDTGDEQVTINDATMFGSRLYLLDASHNRILRHAAIDGGYAGPQQYVKDATDLSNAVSFAIDGYVYVLSKNGEIVRLLRGDRTDFSVSKVDPAVTSAVRLRTESEDGDLYVLDSNPSRIIRYDKTTGALVAQYESDDLNGATDFTVDEEHKKFLVLKGNQVLSFAWPELEN